MLILSGISVPDAWKGPYFQLKQPGAAQDNPYFQLKQPGAAQGTKMSFLGLVFPMFGADP